MPAPEYAFVDANGSAICKVVDGDFFTIDMVQGPNNEAELTSIRFFSDSLGNNQVTPSGGTVKVMGSPDGSTWMDLDFGLFSASMAYSQSRVMPHAIGDMKIARITLSGITGATHFSASMWRS